MVAVITGIFPTDAVSQSSGGAVGSIEWRDGSATISQVQAKIGSGTASFNIQVDSIAKTKGSSGLAKTGVTADAMFAEDFNTLLWHLRADDVGTGTDPNVSYLDPISNWYSYSKNLSSFRQSFTQRPIYSNIVGPSFTEGLYFDGVDDRYNKYTSGLHDSSFTFDHSWGLFLVIGSCPANPGTGMIGSFESVATHQPTKYGVNAGRMFLQDSSGDYHRTSGTGVTSNQIRYVEYDTGTEKASEYVDGFETYSGVTSITNKDDQFTFDSIGGIAGLNDTGYFGGTICEIMFYSGVLPTDRRECIEGYLAYKWNLEAVLPVSHTYKSIDPYTDNFEFSNNVVLSGTYTTIESLSIDVDNGSTLTFYIPTCQNPGDLEVELKYS